MAYPGFNGNGGMGVIPPGSPPDIMDLIAPQGAPQNTSVHISPNQSTSVQPPSVNPSTVETPVIKTVVLEPQKVVLKPQKVVLEPRTTVQPQSTGSNDGKNGFKNVEIQENNKEPKKPMTTAELQRMRINAASEYYRYVILESARSESYDYY